MNLLCRWSFVCNFVKIWNVGCYGLVDLSWNAPQVRKSSYSARTHPGSLVMTMLTRIKHMCAQWNIPHPRRWGKMIMSRPRTRERTEDSPATIRPGRTTCSSASTTTTSSRWEKKQPRCAVVIANCDKNESRFQCTYILWQSMVVNDIERTFRKIPFGS